MRDSSWYRSLVAAVAITGLALALGLAGCDEDTPATKLDVGVDQGPKLDIKADQKVDQKVTVPDKTMWPKDITKPQDITKPKEGGGYKGSPFGCSADRDCFGQKCCPTPWGVKLCAPSCELKL